MRGRAVVVATLLFTTEAHTSEHHQSLELPELISASRLIAIVEADTPADKKTTIAFPKRKNVSGEPLQPYVRIQQRFVVREVLKGDQALAGKKLEVDIADYEGHKTVYEKYYFEGVRKIPIYRTYEPSTQPKGPRSIVFLVSRGERWEFTAQGAIEGVSRRTEIEKQIVPDDPNRPTAE